MIDFKALWKKITAFVEGYEDRVIEVGIGFLAGILFGALVF